MAPSLLALGQSEPGARSVGLSRLDRTHRTHRTHEALYALLWSN